MKIKFIPFVLSVIVVLAGCHLPTGQSIVITSPDAAFTQAAQTVAAELTRVALQTPQSENPAASTASPTPSKTLVYTPSNTSIPCLMVGYSDATIDQTIPDYTVMAPGQAFSKTWRVRNSGTCTWNSSYQLVFDHGTGMGVPNNYAQTLTGGSVAPGQEVDVTVNLTAPMATGTYTGYWRFRDPNNVYFGIGDGTAPWRVVIKVQNSTVVTLSPVVGESGTIRAGGGPWPDYTVGESNADITQSVEAFLSYNMTVIPANATITDIEYDFDDYTVTGNPFGLGILSAYVTNYGPTLEPGDFVAGSPPGNISDWGSTGALDGDESDSQLIAAVQAKVGSSRFQLRLQFGGSNGDPVKDRLTFTNPSLIVTYTTP